VVTSLLDIFVFDALDVGSVNISVLRVFRIARMFRLLKFVKHSHHVTEFRVVIRTLTQALRGTAWCAVILAGVIGTGAVIMTQMAGGYLDDESIPVERRKWMFNMFGTNMRSAHSMFICTFTGSWHSYSRPLIEDVGGHGIFAVFWVVWVMVVNFMTMRVIGALFLKQTMAVASNDEERTAMRNMKKKEMFATHLNSIFESADESGDGKIGESEFEKMIQDPVVIANFAKLNLDVDEVYALFTVLSSDDGSADYNEFLHGALKMNSSARTIDSVQVMHRQMKMGNQIDKILEAIQLLKRHLKVG
jgi:Ca2+-binding EF-hand superfamily protein